jgi:MinD superfamily P-loop ATPase
MIVTYLQDEDIDYVGQMEYSKRVSELINQGTAVIESKEKIADQIKKIYEKVMNLV